MSDQIKQILDAVNGVEAKLQKFSDHADSELKSFGEVSQETKTAIDHFGLKQREFADRLLAIEQKGLHVAEGDKIITMGDQFVNSAQYKSYVGGGAQKATFEVKNTLVGSDTNVAPDRKPGVVGGAFQPLTLEAFLPSTPASSNAIEFTKENVFTNNAAEASEGAQRAESALTWSLVNMPMSTVAHFIKISKQLAADAPALAAYVNTRMIYGVNQKVEVQLAVGDGTAPNISGIFDTGNFTAHGIANAALGSTLKKMVLIRQVMAACKNAGYPADAIMLNASDFASIEIELLTTAAGQTLLSYSEGGQPRLWGLPVIESIGIAADTFAVGSFAQACMIHNREGVVIEMSDSDGDNFQKGLITLGASRRLALAVERPAAIRAGDLTPA